MKLIKKKCPYCGADLKYHYGDHEAKCTYCKQSLIVEYEKLPFTEVKAMLDYYKEKYSKEINSCSYDNYDDYIAEINPEYRKRYEEVVNMHYKRMEELGKRIELCEQMLDEAMDDEMERRNNGK